MNLNKAKLGDDAAIYARREEKTEKQKWAEMNKKQRWSYFRTYYLKPIIFLSLAAAFIIWIIVSIVKPKPDPYVNVSVNNFQYLNFDYVSKDFIKYKNLDPEKQSVMFDSNFNLDNDTNSIQRFAVYAFTGDTDALISGNTAFERYATQGFMLPLDEYLPADLFNELQDRGLIYSTSIVETDVDGTVTETHPEKPYGIYLDELDLFKKYSYDGCRPIFGIITNTKRPENVVEVIEYLFKVNPPDIEQYTGKER